MKHRQGEKCSTGNRGRLRWAQSSSGTPGALARVGVPHDIMLSSLGPNTLSDAGLVRTGAAAQHPLVSAGRVYASRA